jgi:hypothetical protein
MATPRRPEEPKKMGFGGLIFLLLILGGAAWLLMLIFGWGPYQVEGTATPPTPTQAQVAAGTTAPVQANTATGTLVPTGTIPPSATATVTQTATATATPEPMPFILFGDPDTIASTIFYPSSDCKWLFIGGQVVDLKNEPVLGLTLRLFGELGGVAIDQQVVSGSTETYGESGFEFRLEGLVVTSSDSLFLQLVDTNGLPLSNAYGLQTYEDCQKNMLIIKFQQVR